MPITINIYYLADYINKDIITIDKVEMLDDGYIKETVLFNKKCKTEVGVVDVFNTTEWLSYRKIDTTDTVVLTEEELVLELI